MAERGKSTNFVSMAEPGKSTNSVSMVERVKSINLQRKINSETSGKQFTKAKSIKKTKKKTTEVMN